jgi:hypothetical protein
MEGAKRGCPRFTVEYLLLTRGARREDRVPEETKENGLLQLLI